MDKKNRAYSFLKGSIDYIATVFIFLDSINSIMSSYLYLTLFPIFMYGIPFPRNRSFLSVDNALPVIVATCFSLRYWTCSFMEIPSWTDGDGAEGVHGSEEVIDCRIKKRLAKFCCGDGGVTRHTAFTHT